MNDFFANLHWRMPMQSTPIGRWTSWARSLSSGRRRIYSRHLAAVMQLLRPAIPVYRSSHRWELTAWSLFPRINLAVGPILQQSRRSNDANARKVSMEFRNSVKTTVEQLIQNRHVTAVERNDLRVTAKKAVSAPVYSIAYSTEAPLDRVFRRLTPAGNQIATRALIKEESVKLVRRVVEETRRVERYNQTSMVTRQDPVASKVLESARGTETKLRAELAELKNSAPNIMHGTSPMAVAAAQFTVEQLTEHVMRRIDDQIVARKERMGRVF